VKADAPGRSGKAPAAAETARRTQATYDAVASDFLARTRDPGRTACFVDRFAAVLARGARVVDLGSGPGRDTALLAARGLRAFCLDRSRGMLQAGREEFPAVRAQGDLLALPLRTACVQGAWANASLLHLPADDLPAALGEIRRVLAPGGHLHVSVKRGEGCEWETDRYGHPRFFQYWSGARLDAVLRAAGFSPRLLALQRTKTADWLVRQCVVVE
jgi:SAM-dependent methyltransferase